MGQKPQFSGHALIRCDAGGDLGDGHLRRMLALARALRDLEGFGIGFALTADGGALRAVQRAGFEARVAAGPAALAALVAAQKPDLLVLDSGPSRGEAEALRRDVTLMAAIEDASDLRLACDFAYYPPLPQARTLSWAGARTVPRIGWEWALLGLNPHLPQARALGSRPILLVSMAGPDPFGLTQKAARILAPLESTFRIRFVVGGGVKDAGKLAAGIVAMKSNYETVEGADDLATEYATAELALCAFGGAAYELAAFGVPALYLGLTDEDASPASAFEAAGMGVYLGPQLSDSEILDGVKALIVNPARRREMREKCLATLGGGGAARIAADLALALQEEKKPVRAAL